MFDAVMLDAVLCKSMYSSNVDKLTMTNDLCIRRVSRE